MTKSRRQSDRHGYIVIDKPTGWTSHDVVASVRRIVSERRVGHGGTLDPAAVGVLPIAVGLATRTVEYLSSSAKAYRAEITFGIETDTSDGDGRLLSNRGASGLHVIDVQRALDQFLGSSTQRPPTYSAVKVEGRKLYELARQGAAIDVQSRPVSFHRMEIVRWSAPVVTVDIECSKGTYVRSLARDLGEAIGSGAYLSHLVRTRSGPFTLDDAVPLGELPDLIESDGWSGVAFHPDWALLDRASIILDSHLGDRWRNGRDVMVSGCVPGPVRVYSHSGAWLGVGEALPGSDVIKPRKVIPVELHAP